MRATPRRSTWGPQKSARAGISVLRVSRASPRLADMPLRSPHQAVSGAASQIGVRAANTLVALFLSTGRARRAFRASTCAHALCDRFEPCRRRKGPCRTWWPIGRRVSFQRSRTVHPLAPLGSTTRSRPAPSGMAAAPVRYLYRFRAMFSIQQAKKRFRYGTKNKRIQGFSGILRARLCTSAQLRAISILSPRSRASNSAMKFSFKDQ